MIAVNIELSIRREVCVGVVQNGSINLNPEKFRDINV